MNPNSTTRQRSSDSRLTVSRRAMLSALGLLSLGGVTGVATAHPDGAVTGGPGEDDGYEGELHGHGAPDPSLPLMEHDASTANEIVSEGPSGKVTKNLVVAGRGERLLPGGTTDVWAHEGYAYIGTFNTPCGTGAGFGSGELVDDLLGPGIAVFDVRNNNNPEYVGSIPSVAGSRTNDVKVATMNAGTILAHTNEPCDGGPGGFELYNVDDPLAPEHLASVQTDDINELLRESFGFADFGVHNTWLFTQGSKDYVAAVVESEFGNFQIFDITDPTSPMLVGAWGAESLFDPAVNWFTTTDFNQILLADAYLFDGFGSSQNRFLHDVTVSEDGTKAYLANWDAGLVLLDISDPTSPEFVSQAINPSAGDGEVNSHQAWPTSDGTVVVETEEDFSAWVESNPPGNLTFGEGSPETPLPGTAVSTDVGDDFEANQTGNVGTVDGDSLVVESGPLAGNTYPAIELAGDQPKFSITGPISGKIVYIGRACDGDPLLNAGEFVDGGIAVVRRGACTFREKNFNAADIGADAIVIANNNENSPWGGIRIWDYADETNPKLASTFDTVCSAASEPIDDCDERGTYSVHNVVVEGDKVYVSWYSDGVLVLDISDPYNPVEVARYNETGPEFETENGGIQDVWGIYKVPDSPSIYASDRNGGLYVLMELGSGSGKQGRDGDDRGQS
jgi:hypothetical protein